MTPCCWLAESIKPEGTESDSLLENQSEGGALLGSSQMSAPEDYWFFTNRVNKLCCVIHKKFTWCVCTAGWSTRLMSSLRFRMVPIKAVGKEALKISDLNRIWTSTSVIGLQCSLLSDALSCDDYVTFVYNDWHCCCCHQTWSIGITILVIISSLWWFMIRHSLMVLWFKMNAT